MIYRTIYPQHSRVLRPVHRMQSRTPQEHPFNNSLSNL
uniref:Ubiquitin conjugating enzyme E2 J1 n=1 Tax=Molossus molossus TaxID=27622 RepID=A0A7J8GUD6_MOLMO|nr:ubiquitin conjugating enzyme E2 J1 [Molossus molossus]